MASIWTSHSFSHSITLLLVRRQQQFTVDYQTNHSTILSPCLRHRTLLLSFSPSSLLSLSLFLTLSICQLFASQPNHPPLSSATAGSSGAVRSESRRRDGRRRPALDPRWRARGDARARCTPPKAAPRGNFWGDRRRDASPRHKICVEGIKNANKQSEKNWHRGFVKKKRFCCR